MAMQPKYRFMMLFLVALLVIAVGLIINLSSGDSHDDQTQTVDHIGSVETSLSVEHADSTHDVILTTHKIWVHNSEYATLIHRDTVPALDSMRTDAENANGDTRSVQVKRDYQFFITVR
jgi:hypothetical protein